jgi:voltage-gated potassium channel
MYRYSLFPAHLRKALLIFILLVLTGTMFYSQEEHWKMLDSLYFSVISLTTVGYGDMHPTHELAKIFTMFYVLFGVGLVLYIFTSISHSIIKRNEREIDQLEHQMKRLEEGIKQLQTK